MKTGFDFWVERCLGVAFVALVWSAVVVVWVAIIAGVLDGLRGR